MNPSTIQETGKIRSRPGFTLTALPVVRCPFQTYPVSCHGSRVGVIDIAGDPETKRILCGNSPCLLLLNSRLPHLWGSPVIVSNDQLSLISRDHTESRQSG